MQNGEVKYPLKHFHNLHSLFSVSRSHPASGDYLQASSRLYHTNKQDA